MIRQSGSNVDCRLKAERTPSQRGSDNVSESQFGETLGQRGSDDEKSDDSLSDRGSTYLREEAGKDPMSVNLTRFGKVPAEIKEMRRRRKTSNKKSPFVVMVTKTNGLIFPKRRLKIEKIKHRPQKMVEGPFQSGRGFFQL